MTFNEAVQYYGSQVKLAEALGVKRQAVLNWWYRAGKVLPPYVQIFLEYETNGDLKADSWAKTRYAKQIYGNMKK
jgi:DNA-binding transcriptional regulator YdaS (Cro superfamily)